MDTNGEVTEAPAVEKPTEDKLNGMLSGILWNLIKSSD